MIIQALAMVAGQVCPAPFSLSCLEVEVRAPEAETILSWIRSAKKSILICVDSFEDSTLLSQVWEARWIRHVNIVIVTRYQQAPIRLCASNPAELTTSLQPGTMLIDGKWLWYGSRIWDGLHYSNVSYVSYWTSVKGRLLSRAPDLLPLVGPTCR